jgi:TRAP-type C4-dicarboxylate transport system permease large subunit
MCRFGNGPLPFYIISAPFVSQKKDVPPLARTATEAAGVGAFRSFVMALLKGKLNAARRIQCLFDRGKTTAMIFLVIIGLS